MFVSRKFRFNAAHRIPGHPLCKRLHGHTYWFVVTLGGKIDSHTGMLIDFDELQAVVEQHVLSHLDHSYLNDVLERPTAELLCVWIWDHLAVELPQLYEVQLYEQAENWVTYRGARDVFVERQEP